MTWRWTPRTAIGELMMNNRSSCPTIGSLRPKWLPLLVAACFGTAQATPTLPQVVAGQATFGQQGNVYSITNTPNTIINWQSFSVGAGEVTRFIQQNSSSSVLNRILGQDPSQIFGALQSNGRVFLINPNGVMFGRDSRVDVAGLVASSLNLSNADFLAGRNNFTPVAGAGAVSNAGSITTPSGGQVFLVAPNVDNSGIITSPQGDVILAAGHAVQLVEAGNPSVQVVVSAPDNAALNLGQVIAQGGRIGIYGALVNQRGRLNANSAVVGENGKIVLKASRDTLLEAGSVTSATGAGQGGDVSVLGQRVALTGDARIDASGQTGGGTVLVGGDYQGKNAAVQNAQQTVVGADARIQADAIARGDGGKVVVWADGATSMAGQVSARGGAAGGNGGIAESSGKQFLDFRGTVDLRAARGKMGTLLLDPNNISIDTGSDTYITQTGGSPFVYEANNTPAVLTPLTLTNQLAISDVNVYTGTGSITVLSPVSWSNSSELTLSATTGIAINSQVTNTGGGKLSLYTTGGNITQTSVISVPTLAAIADTGSVTLTHNGNTVGTLAGSGATGFSYHDADALTIGTVAGGAIPTQVGVSSSGGSVEIMTGVTTVTGGLAIDSIVSAPSGTLNFRDYKGDITQTAEISAPSALIIADEGAVTLNHTANNLTTLAGYSNAPSGFGFVNSGALTVGVVSGSHGVLSFGTAPLSLTALTGDLTVSDTTYGVTAGNSGVSALTLTATSGQVLGSGIVKGGATVINSATGTNLAGTQNEIGSLTAGVTGTGNITLVNNRALSIASVSTAASNAAVDISTTAASAFGIEVAGTINAGASGYVALNAGGTGAITRTGASSVISADSIMLQNSSTGAIGTSGLPLLTNALNSDTTDFHIGASGAGPQGLYLAHTGRMSLNSASHYGSNAAISIGATNDLTIAGNLSAGTANLTLDTSGSLASDNSSVLSGGTINLLATQNINVGSVVSPTGSISMVAQQALTARGISTAALNAGNVTLTANGGDMILGADGALDARSSSAGGNGTVSLTSAGAIQMLNSNVIKAGALDMKAATGIYGISNAIPLAIMSDSVQAQNTSSGVIRLSNSGTNLSVGGASSYGIDQQGAGNVYLDNASGYTTSINKSITSNGGSIAVYGSGGISLLASQPITSNGGGIQLFAFDTNAQLTMPANSSVSSGGGLINLKADAMSFTGSALHAGSGGVAIGPGNGDTLIRAGTGATDVSGAPGTRVLGLTEAELRTIDTTGYIYLGNGSQTADVTISGALDLYNGGALNGMLSLNGGSGNVFINDVLTTGQATIANANASKTITIGNGGQLQTHGTTVFNALGGVVMNGNGSIATNGSVLYMQGTTGVTLNGTASIATAGGGLTIDAGSVDGVFTSQAGTSISSGGATPLITADNMSLAGTITSTSGVALAPHTAGVLVKVGALAADSSGVLRLTSSELNGVNAPILRIGSATSGAVAIESALGNTSGGAFEHVGSALSLTSGGAITQSAGATIGGISKVSLTAGSVALDQANGTGRIAGSTSGSFAYRSANQISVETVDGVSGITSGAGQAIKLKSDGAGISQNAGAPLIVSSGTLVLEAAGPAELNLITNNFTALGGALNQGGAGVKGPSEIYVANNLSVGSVTAIDGVTTINGLSTNNQDLELSTGFITHTLTVSKPIDVGTASVSLETDNLTLNDTVTGNTVVLQPHTTGRPITVGSATCQVGGVGGCLAITRLDRVVAPNIGIGRRYADPEAPGELYVAGITTAGTAVATDINPITTMIGLGSGGTITQGGPIVVNTLGLSAGGVVTLGDAGNLISTLAAETNGTAISYSNSAGFTVGVLPANTLIESGGGSLSGVHTMGGNVALTAGGGATSELAISQLINAGSGDVGLTSHGAVYGGTGTNDITAGTLSVTANGTSTRGAGIGAIDGAGGLHTTVPRIASLTAPAAGIRIASLSNLVVGPASAASGDVVTTTGTLALSTATGHPLTINGDLAATGNIDLTAGSAGSSNSLDQINFAQNVTSSGGNITINANGVTGAHVPTGGNVSSHLFVPSTQVPPPTVAACIANPTLSGCSSVLPSLAVCTSAPTTEGCSVVLPGLAVCTAAPTTAGCSAVLPGLAVCVSAPTTPGCSAVLPALAVCMTDPTTAGCSAVLPSVSVCVAAPTTAGCSAVLPTLAVCAAAPTLPGCSVVLPTVAACAAAPTLPGCSAVLPTVAACTATPTLPGCSAVLPTVAACSATPTLPGCSAVLPTVAACTAAPTLPGCSAVLPTVAACSAAPTLPGCSAVLPSVAACTITPTLTGCSAVLPGLAACVATPTLAGCSAVLPPLSVCVAVPGTAGCSAVLPDLAVCVATPSAAGCSAVLPSLASCSSAPTTAGCSAVLPTLAQCTSTPTLAGCSVVLPPVNVCLSNPNAAGCVVVVPPVQSQSDGPIAQALNTTINVINAVTPAGGAPVVPIVARTSSGGGSGSSGNDSGTTSSTGGPAATSSTPDDSEKKDVKKEDVVAQKTETKKEVQKKTYCN
ncbi:two-partner secretion domain-containing protein [Duganella sp. LjRoot269]|uniref:two-partner secretion domain-containing protein n=1 Tax=Duganella sp. LjRoot269 TaxID=3342305 RepID=UPI003F4FF60C